MQSLKESLKINKNLNNMLDEAYDEALENEEFKNFVSKLKLKRSVLKKYTSLLETSLKEYQNCQNCKNILSCKNKVEGYAYLPKIKDETLEFSYRPCKYKKKLEKENEFHQNTMLFSVPEDIKNANIKSIYKNDRNRFETILWMDSFIQKYKEDKHQKGLYLYGNFGCGKTYLISALFNELAKENIKSAIVFYPEYLRDLKASFNSENKTEFSEKYNYIKKIPLLLIDDIGAENPTPWSRDEVLCPLLQYRMDEKLPTFFTSNLDLSSLENHLALTGRKEDEIKAGRLISRIKQLTDYKEMISQNLRKWKKYQKTKLFFNQMKKLY